MRFARYSRPAVYLSCLSNFNHRGHRGRPVTALKERVTDACIGFTKTSGRQAIGSGAQAIESGGRAIESGGRAIEPGGRAIESGGRAIESGGRAIGSGSHAIESVG